MGRKPVQERYFRRTATPGGKTTYHRTHKASDTLHTCTSLAGDTWQVDWWRLDDVLRDIGRGLVEEITKAECLVADRPMTSYSQSYVTRYETRSSMSTAYYWYSST